MIARQAPVEDIILRAHRPGDIGWVIQKHGELYSAEYGWNIEFEALVAEICVKFLREFQPESEHCWIAERAGERLGSVFLVNAGDGIAQLRMLIVDPKARGLGLGRRLVEECIAGARARGYRRMKLWTNTALDAARHIYISAGFQLVEETPHESWGKQHIGQMWEMDL